MNPIKKLDNNLLSQSLINISKNLSPVKNNKIDLSYSHRKNLSDINFINFNLKENLNKKIIETQEEKSTRRTNSVGNKKNNNNNNTTMNSIQVIEDRDKSLILNRSKIMNDCTNKNHNLKRRIKNTNISIQFNNELVKNPNVIK